MSAGPRKAGDDRKRSVWLQQPRELLGGKVAQCVGARVRVSPCQLLRGSCKAPHKTHTPEESIRV